MAQITDVLEAIADLKADLIDKINDVLAQNIVATFCHHCGGDGSKATDNGDIECPDCSGTGLRNFAKVKSA